MVILTVPLIDSSLNVNLYHIHNLPMLHPTLEIQVEYELEGTYFNLALHIGSYITLLTTLPCPFINSLCIAFFLLKFSNPVTIIYFRVYCKYIFCSLSSFMSVECTTPSLAPFDIMMLKCFTFSLNMWRSVTSYILYIYKVLYLPLLPVCCHYLMGCQ